MRLSLETIRQTVSGAGGRLQRSTRGYQIGGGEMSAAGPSDTLYPAPRITAALRFGEPQRRAFLGDTIMPSFPRDSWKVLIITEDDSHLVVYDTERGLMEPRKQGKFTQSTGEFNMARFGFEYGVDNGLATRFADAAFRLAVGSASRAQWAVRLDLENRKAVLCSTSGLWPAAHRNDESGTPWDGAGGDGKASIDAGIVQVLSAHPGYTRRDFNLAFSQFGWEAFQNDTTFAALTNGPVSMGRYMTTELAEEYLGLAPGSIIVGDATVSVDGTVQHMWGESAILWLRTDPEQLTTEFGGDVFALFHEMGGGNAYPPYFTPNPPADWYPFEALGLPVVHDYTVGYFMFDMLS